MTTVISSGAVAQADAGLPAVPAAYQAAAKAKLKRDRESYGAFRAVDQQEHERAWKRHADAAVAAAENEVRLFREDVETLEPETEAALKAFRDAEDRAREAREYARRQQAEVERVKDTGSAEEATDALLRADTADGVAADRQAAAERARAEFDGFDRDLWEAREGLAGAERVVVEAEKQAQVPAGAAPISDVTIRACTSYMQLDEVWDTLSERDKLRVRQAGQPRDMMSDEQFRAMVREVLGRRGATA
jgi:hypothetical protein